MADGDRCYELPCDSESNVNNDAKKMLPGRRKMALYPIKKLMTEIKIYIGLCADIEEKVRLCLVKRRYYISSYDINHEYSLVANSPTGRRQRLACIKDVVAKLCN